MWRSVYRAAFDGFTGMSSVDCCAVISAHAYPDLRMFGAV
jgi:hypothetical protein